MVDRVILTGFMCSGKTSVGRRLAERLGWDFIDFDESIERREGRRIADLFRERGEAHFRALEARLTDEVSDRRRVVLAPGGGWAAQPELVARLRPGSLVVWLRARPETVHERHRAQAEVVRPLLEGADPLQAIVSILQAREPAYARADLRIDTDERDPADIAAEIEARIRADLTPRAGPTNNSAAGG